MSLAVMVLEYVMGHVHTNKSSGKPLTCIQQTVIIFTIEHICRYATLLLGFCVCLGDKQLGYLACYLCRWMCVRWVVKQGVTSE